MATTKVCPRGQKYSVKKSSCVYPKCPKGRRRVGTKCVRVSKVKKATRKVRKIARKETPKHKTGYIVFCKEVLREASKDYAKDHAKGGKVKWSRYFARAVAPWRPMSKARKAPYEAKAARYNARHGV
jgi:hypothetical protein